MKEHCLQSDPFTKILMEAWHWFCEAQPEADQETLIVSYVAMNFSAMKARIDKLESQIEAMKQQLPIGRIPDDRYN